jgi:hypothetical protein
VHATWINRAVTAFIMRLNPLQLFDTIPNYAMPDGPDGSKQHVACRVWRKRHGDDVTKDRPNEGVAPIDPTEATRSVKYVRLASRTALPTRRQRRMAAAQPLRLPY